MPVTNARRWRQLIIRLATLSLSTVLALGVLEAGLRLTRDSNRFYPYRKNSVKASYPTEEITRGVSGIAYFTTNSFGCRGPELANQKNRMLVMGGSTTACTALDDNEAWPQLVMDRVNEHFGQDDFLWVTNSAIDGTSTRTHIVHAKFLAPTIPGLNHVLVYCGFNDMAGWLIQDKNYNHHFPLTDENIAIEIPRSFAISCYDAPGTPWYRRLELWKRMSQLKAYYKSRRTAEARAQGKIIEDDRLQWLAQEREKRAHETKRSVDLGKMATLDDALSAYAENVSTIIGLVRDAGSTPILMAQAIQFDELSEQEKKDLWMGAMDGGKTYIEMSQLQELLRKYNDRMETIAKAHGVLFIPLPKLLEGNRDLYYDSIHFHEAGARAVGRVVADYLIQNVYESPASKTPDSDHG